MSTDHIWEELELVTEQKRSTIITITVDQFAQVMGISRPTVYRAIEIGEIRGIKILGTRRIPVSEVFKLLGLGEAG
jgi:excisionase family DNA binding protein